jgi:tRNA(fMet)-specific endonuclease VapC
MSAARFLLDTDICIHIRRRRSPHLARRFETLQRGEATLSVISFGELHFGAEKGPDPLRARYDLEELVSFLPIAPMPAEAGRIYGEIRAVLERKGEMIGGNDCWIAAHALASGLVLVSNNVREFRRVPGLKYENWIK